MPAITSNTVVLVTASSAGLGAATAHAFAEAGASVVVNYFSNAQKAEDLVLTMSQLHHNNNGAGKRNGVGSSVSGNISSATSPRHVAIRADMSQRSEIIRLVEETVATMGHIDVVVSNQGWTRICDFSDLDENVNEDDWDRCYQMNVKSHLFLFHAAKKYLDAWNGAFITTASLAGVIPSGSSIAYSVTKAAQIHLVKSLAKISGSIRVNSISPGILLTDWGRQFPKAKLDQVIGESPLKRLALVEDVAQQIVALARYQSVTGTNCIIDAGWSLK